MRGTVDDPNLQSNFPKKTDTRFGGYFFFQNKKLGNKHIGIANTIFKCKEE